VPKARKDHAISAQDARKHKRRGGVRSKTGGGKKFGKGVIVVIELISTRRKKRDNFFAGIFSGQNFGGVWRDSERDGDFDPHSIVGEKKKGQ